MLPIARSNDTHWLSDKLCQHWLPPILGVPKAPQDESHVCDQSHHNDQPFYQRLALVGKKSSSDVMFPVQLMSKCPEDLRHKPCASADLRCLVMQEKMPNMTPNARINVIRPLNASKRQCHFDDHNDRGCHNNCDVSTHPQDYFPIATEEIATSNYKLIFTQKPNCCWPARWYIHPTTFTFICTYAKTWLPVQLCPQMHQMQCGWPSLWMPSCLKGRGSMSCSCRHCVPAHLVFDEIKNRL